MGRWLNTLGWSLARWLLRLRYRVRVVAPESLWEVRGPALIMPNHPGYIDPALVLSHVRLSQPVRPVVRTTMYRRPYLYPLMRLVQALEVPDLSEQSLSARDRTLAMIDAVVAGLDRGECFLIYPAGRTQRTGLEAIGGNRAVAEILQRCPRTRIVLVRTRGVWGSMLTRAQTGQAPEFGKRLLQGIGCVLANLLFFTPRRDVVMTVELTSAEELSPIRRETLNPWLEQWYNREGLEPPRYVPYHRWFGPRTYSYPQPNTGSEVDLSQIRQKTIDAVNDMVAERLGHPLESHEREPQTSFDALGLDSLDRMELTLQVEDRFGFHSDQVANSLGDLWRLAEGHVAARNDADVTVPRLWWQPPTGCEASEILADNLPEAFVRRALQHLDAAAVADPMSGVLTYRRMLVATLLLSRRFRALPDGTVGIMLPASVAADLAYFGLLLADKLPAMMNWTLGPSHLRQAVDKLGLSRIVTSRKLVDRMAIEPPGAEFVYIEDLHGQISRGARLRTLLASYVCARRWLRTIPRPDPDRHAVVLFTSGSESTPKAVPLSHSNLITNIRASTRALQSTRRDRMLGFLPPFHSFGLMGTLVAPLITGIRMVHYPDPTQAAGLVRTASVYQPTLLMTTPTFLSHVLRCATADDLRSLRVVGTGAEKCSEAIFARAAELVPDVTILEGYGVTECSPLVASNRVDCLQPGSIGMPADGVEVRIVDVDTYEPVLPNARGMLLVRGPGVFSGYLRHDGPEPFIELDGLRWYVTGDLVQQDTRGFLYLCGRLKRFLKVGGEMVSLPALEDPLAARWPPTEEGPQVAVEGIETPGGRHIVLFTTPPTSLQEANQVLAQAGLRGIMRLDEVRQVKSIPLLGTGKIDYKVLRQWAAAPAASSDPPFSGSRTAV